MFIDGIRASTTASHACVQSTVFEHIRTRLSECPCRRAPSMVARDAPIAPIRRTMCPIIGVRSITDAHTGLAALKTASFAL